MNTYVGPQIYKQYLHCALKPKKLILGPKFQTSSRVAWEAGDLAGGGCGCSKGLMGDVVARQILGITEAGQDIAYTRF